MPDRPPHMSAEDFRRAGHAVVDWIAAYHERLGDLPVCAPVQPGAVAARLPAAAPEGSEPVGDVLADLDAIVVPALVHWQSPRFFGYFPANASGPAMLGDLLSAGLGVQGMSWATSPAATELETRMLDWLADLLGLPAAFTSKGDGGGVLQDSASSATLCALLAARERATGGAANRSGVTGPLTVYASAEAHSSVDKAVRIAGIGSARLRRIATDAGYALRPDALAEALAADLAAGATPVLVTATVGTTSSGAVDPVRAIGAVCRRHDVWLHVDAAWAGSAAVCPEHRGLHDGLELADSYVCNPHKWLLTNFDCSAFYVRDRRALTAALGIQPEYLRTDHADAVIDYRDWQVPLGRRFRALKLWFVLRAYGAEGLRAHIRRHVRWAAELADLVRGDPDWELVAPPSLALLCLAHRAGDEVTRAVLASVNASGRALVTHTRLDGRYVLRVAIGAVTTERADVLALWELLATAGRAAGGGRDA